MHKTAHTDLSLRTDTILTELACLGKRIDRCAQDVRQDIVRRPLDVKGSP